MLIFCAGMAQEINARSDVLRIERQLEEARGRLAAIRQGKYKLKAGESEGDTTWDQSDQEGYGSATLVTGYETSSSNRSAVLTHSHLLLISISPLPSLLSPLFVTRI